MTGDELLSVLRNDVLRDMAKPYLWSDDLLYIYLNEAQEQFCRKTYCLMDAEEITTEVGQPVYPLNHIWVFSVRDTTRARDLENYTRRVLPSLLSDTLGAPQAYVCDDVTRSIRLYPSPEAVVTLEARVARLPRVKISDTTSPEIPEEYHLDLVEWAAYRALRNNDIEGKNEAVAEEKHGYWRKRVLEAKREFYRYRMGSNVTAVRTWTGKRG